MKTAFIFLHSTGWQHLAAYESSHTLQTENPCQQGLFQQLVRAGFKAFFLLGWGGGWFIIFVPLKMVQVKGLFCQIF